MYSKSLVCAALALACAVVPSLAQSPATLGAPQTPGRAPGRDFDAAWTSYFGPEHFAYMAVKNPNIDGPLMHRPLDSDPAAVPAQAKEGNPAQFLRAFIEDAKKEKIIEANLTELTPEGFAVGLAAGADPKKEPAALLVAPRNAKLSKFHDWVIAHYKKQNGADSVAEVKIEGFTGVKLLKSGKTTPVIVNAETVVLLSNSEAELAKALKRAKDGKDTLATARYYKRGRSRVGADAALFFMVDPMPLLNLMEQAGQGPNREENAKKIADAKKNFQAIDVLLVQLSAAKEASHFDFSVLLDPASPAYKNFKQLAGTSGVKASSLVGMSAPAFLSIIRPADLTGGVAPEHREQLTAQLNSLKGMLQVQTGLEFDTDVAPWWGNEIALTLMLPEGGGAPEGALLFEAKDPKAAQGAVDKVVRHVGVSQNRTFSERKVGDTTLKVAEPPQGGPATPVNPTLGLANGYVVLATGPNVILTALESKAKLAQAPGYARMGGAIPPEKLGLVIYLKTDVLVKAQGPNAQATTGPGAAIKKLADEVESIVVGLGWPDEESVRLTVLFNGR